VVSTGNRYVCDFVMYFRRTR